MNSKFLGPVLIIVGLATAILQVYYVRESGRYWLIGGISSAIIVLGIAAFFIDLKGFEDESQGSGARRSFGDLPMGLKVVVGLAILAGISHAAAFETGLVMM